MRARKAEKEREEKSPTGEGVRQGRPPAFITHVLHEQTDHRMAQPLPEPLMQGDKLEDKRTQSWVGGRSIGPWGSS